MPSLMAELYLFMGLVFFLHSPGTTYIQGANTADFGEAVEDNWGRR